MFLTVTFLCRISFFIVVESIVTYTPWRLENMTDLFCPDSCGQDTECCACENKRSWQLSGQVVDLHVRYTDTRGSSIVYTHWDDLNYNHTRLSHANGRLRKLPINMCSFPSTVELVLDKNEIETLDGINCLFNLDSLYLTQNNLEIIYNTTFSNLTSLRNLYLSNNKIGSIEPNSFNLGGGQYILNIDISSNQLESVDVTNFNLKAFCKMSYSNNRKPLQIKNDLNYMALPDEKIGCGGVIEFENVSLQTFFNYSDFGLDAWNKMYKNLHFSLSVVSEKLTCDCNMAELFSDDSTVAAVKKLWQQMQNYTCERPDELNGTKLIDIYTTNPEKEDLLVCNITDSCPRKCRCFDQPSRDRVVVDCQGQNLNIMPENLPWGNGDRLELLLAGNDIQQMDDRPYLSRVADLDLSRNPLSHISEKAASVFPRDAKLNATGNKLTSLPRHFQNRNPTFLSLGNILLACSCEDLWMKTWLSFYREYESHTLYICENLGGQEITMADFSSLHCLPDTFKVDTILGSLICFVVCIILFILGRLFLFPEIYVIYRRRLRSRVKSDEFDYDGYISFYDEDDLQRKWVMRGLAKYLESRGYTLFIPVRDSAVAVSREEYLRNIIQTSRNFIVILSEKYFQKEKEEAETTQQIFTQFEFNQMWGLYKNDMRRNLIIINFDNMSASEIDNRWVKACCRVGELDDFTERQGLLMEIIERKMSPPCRMNNETYVSEGSTRCAYDFIELSTRCPYDFNARLVFDRKK